MGRPLLLLTLAVALAGCHHRSAPVDPFFGRTTVAPPGTGTVCPSALDPYLQGAPPATVPVQPIQPLEPYPVQPGQPQPYQQPPPSQYQVLPPASQYQIPPSMPYQPAPGAGSPAAPVGVGPASLNSSAQARPIDIMQLPPAGSRWSKEGRSGVVAASHEEPAAPSIIKWAQSGASLDDRYGFDPEYRWLRGKIEYSQIDRCWKLRYIPCDGATDKYGGSVILTDAKLLGGYERGDFIEVHGRVGHRDPNRPGFAPTYEVTTIKPFGRR